jgi:heme-degrading monooxygenase HmoA
MYVRMSTWATRPGMDDESRRLYASGARDIFYRQPGIVQASLLALPDTDQRMTLSVWESVEDHERFVAGDLVQAVHMFDHVFAPGGTPQANLWQLLAGDWPTSN